MSSESVPSKSDFVGKIVTDPTKPPNAVLLSGYLGDSSDDGHTRLYFDLELSSHVDIPNEAILHREPYELYGHGHIIIFMVWVKRDALIKPGRDLTQAAQARYFQGEIMKAYGATAADFQATAQAAGAADIGEAGVKASVLFGCRTEEGLPCPTQIPILCVQQTIPKWQCDASLVDGCPSQLPVLCESKNPICDDLQSVDLWRCSSWGGVRCFPSQDWRVRCLPPRIP
jgi:hypothetical protein